MYHFYVLFTLLTVFTLTVILSFKWIGRISPMTAMVLTSYLGMSIGLTIGVLFGFTFQSNIFETTLISMAIAATAGLLYGLIHGAITAIEGFMAGIMGGMMGAMLGVMASPEDGLAFTNLFMIITIFILILLVIFTSSRGEVYSGNKWLIKPLLLFFFILVYLWLGDQLVNATFVKDFHDHHH